MISIALFKPDIPQNTAAILRLCACFRLKLLIIEPCGFNLEDKRFKRVAMDYIDLCNIIRYSNYDDFYSGNKDSRIILMTTKAKKNIIVLSLKKMMLFCLEEKALVFQKIYTEKLYIDLKYL